MFTMKKQMLIDGHQLPVILRRNVVSIDNNPVLWSFINQNPLRNTQKLIDYIQADYQKIFGEKFPLSDNSFIMEIWGHMYFESFLVNYKKWGKVLFPFGLYQRFVKACDKIDCGVSKIDRNRWLWDFLAFLTPVVGRMIPKRRPSF
jgi:hypothetical protein